MKPPVPTDLGWQGFSNGPWETPGGSGDRPRRFGITLFLLSLSSLFIASLLAYTLIRHWGLGAATRVQLPRGLWVSTAVLLACGLAIWGAQRAGRAGSLRGVQGWLVTSWLLSIAFLCVQGPSLYLLVDSFRQLEGKFRAEMLVVVLIVLHALHILGGLIPLTALTARLLRGSFTPVELSALRSCATYWHFLEAVWLVMFATLLIVG